jgi:hypothetical protein
MPKNLGKTNTATYYNSGLHCQQNIIIIYDALRVTLKIVASLFERIWWLGYAARGLSLLLYHVYSTGH